MAEWGQAPERIERLKSSAEFAIYTPGSEAGLPVSILRNFAPPPQAISREQEQEKSSKIQTAISFGSAVLGAFLGRKVVSSRSAYRVGTAMKSASRMRKKKMDVARAQERAEALQAQLSELEVRLQDDIDRIELSFAPELEELEEISVKTKSTDITLEIFGLAWMPFRRDAGGRLIPDWG